MEPKDRVETVVKTKMGAQREKASGGDESAPGAAHSVSRAEVERVVVVSAERSAWS